MGKLKHFTMTEEQRKEKFDQLKEKYPQKIPVICIPGPNQEKLDKTKFLVPKDLTLGEFTFIVRQRLQLKKEEALLLFCNNELLRTSDHIDLIHENYKCGETGFLYITYTKENCFGF